MSDFLIGKLKSLEVNESIKLGSKTVTNFIDSSAVSGIVDSSYVQARQVDLQRDSAFITNIIDSNYVLARAPAQDFLDSSEAISLIDSSYVQARQIKYTNSDFADSAFVTTQINSVIDAAPGALNTLNELAAALGDDANFSTTITNQIATKLDSSLTIGLIDSAYVLARAPAQDFLDSSETIALIDSAYVLARAPAQDFLDSSEVISLIDSSYVQARTSAGTDSAATQAMIDSSIGFQVDSSYVQARQSAGGGGSSVTISDNAPGSPSAGDQWYNSSNGTMYIYYNDGNSSQWVSTSGYTTVSATSVISDNAPAGALAGDLWYNSSNGIMYLYYNDGNSSQWVSTTGYASGDGGLDSSSTIALIDSAYVQARSSSGSSTLFGLSDVTITNRNPTHFENVDSIGHLWINDSSGHVYVCIKAVDSDNIWRSAGASDVYTISKGPQPTAGTRSLSGTQGTSFTHSLASDFANGSAFSYALATGSLPNGISVSGTNLTGTPTVGGTFNFTIRATDDNSQTGDKAYTLSLGMAGFYATGGTETTAGGYKYHTFTSSGTLNVTGSKNNVEVLSVAGGGGGGRDDFPGRGAGGGGAGGFVNPQTINTLNSNLTIVIGAGGTNSGANGAAGTQGGNTTCTNIGTAIGGGGGGSHSNCCNLDNATSGGSGGGGTNGRSGKAGTTGQGNSGGTGGGTGYRGGGGGGKGAAGASGSSGGGGGIGSNTYSAWATATSTGDGGYYAGGGAGGGSNASGPNFTGAGGQGGGGETPNGAGDANTGGGGGGMLGSSTAGSGGSGILIVRYTT